MAKINQVGPGRKTSGTIDGVTYVTTRNGNTYARIQGKLPAYVFKNPAALKRQCIFKMVQEHANYHLRTLKKTISRVGNGNVVNRYTQLNYKHLAAALDALADRMLEGTVVTLTEIEAAIAAYATEHTEAITIAAKNGYGKVYLTGAWPDTITLRASGGDSTIIVIVAENGSTTTITPAEGGSTTVISGGDNGSSGSSDSGSGSGSGSETPTVAAPVISGTTPFAESTSATISCATAGASIYYTVDGSTPTSASTAYSEALTITDTTTVKAIAVKDGVSSSVTTKTFTKSSGGDGPEGE
jgi:hypothetical protein